MPSSFTPSLRLTLPVTGENPGTWGDLVNNGITSLVDSSVAGYAAVAMTNADYTLTTANGAADESRKMMLNISGTLTAARNVICPTASKLYFIKNATTGGFAITLKTAAGSGISIPNGRSMVLMCNGTDVIDATDYSSSLNTATLSASSTVSGAGFSAYLASPPAIGGTVAAAGSFTALSYSTTLTGGTGVVALGTNQFYKDASGNIGIGTAAPGSKLDVKGTLRLSGATSGYVGLAPAAAAGSTTYTLPSTDGTSGQVLQTNGTATLSWATPSTGITNFTSNLNTTTPNATVPYVQLLATNAATNVDVAITPKGAGAFSLQVADNTSTGGNKRGTNAVDLQTVRSTNTQVASGPNSFVVGRGNVASGATTSAIAIGYVNTASGATAPIAIGQSNNASGPNGAIAIGLLNGASGADGAVAIGYANTASGQSSFACGNQNTTSAQYSFACGSINSSSATSTFVAGNNNTADGINSTVLGGQYGTTRSITGNRVYPAGFGTVLGARQFTNIILCVDTTSAAGAYLTSDGISTVSANNIIVLPNNSAFYFKGTIVAGVTGGGNSKVWEVSGLVKRSTSGGGTSFVGTPTVTSPFADTGASAWAVAVNVELVIGGVNIIVTGAAATNIRWVGNFQVTEMTY